MGTRSCPHPDFAGSFSKIRSMYFINLAECLRRVDPITVTYAMQEQEWVDEPRNLTELLDAMDRLTKQMWYKRHKNLAWKIEKGKHKIVCAEERETDKLTGQTHTIDDIWTGALRSAKKAERGLGKGNYGPLTDFEWGMINGKPSALGWTLGLEWNQLNT
jgi:hypothetical protein